VRQELPRQFFPWANAAPTCGGPKILSSWANAATTCGGPKILSSWVNAATACGGPKIATALCAIIAANTAITCCITLLYRVRTPAPHHTSYAVIHVL